VRSEGFYVNEKIPLKPAGIEPGTRKYRDKEEMKERETKSISSQKVNIA